MSTSASRARGAFRYSDFARFWAAQTVSGFGSYVTTFAVSVLVVLALGGSASDVGLVNASRWLPYLVLGLVAGALVERRRRRTVLVAADLGRAVLLGAVPLLWAIGALTLGLVMLLMVAFGTLSLLGDAAARSIVPRLVPRDALLDANARLDQGFFAAQTSGPLMAGGLVSALGAPVAVLVDAVSYLLSAVVIGRIRTSEDSASVDADRPRDLRRDIGDGLRWVYRHATLAPLALSTHGWFLFNSMLTTVFVPFALLRLHMNAFELSVALTAAGAGAFAGSAAAPRLGLRYGAGRTVVACRALYPLAWAVVAVIPHPSTAATPVLAILLACLGQLLYGLAMGVENANETGYQQAVTPDELQSRMGTTMRSVNRGMVVVGAPLGGLLADSVGFRPLMWVAIAGLALVAGGLAASPFRHARHDEVLDLRRA